jgi:hypothetical protein
MAHYSKRHYRLVSPPADTAERQAERAKHRAAIEQAHAEMRAKYPILTAENAGEAIAFQEMRFKELMGH